MKTVVFNSVHVRCNHVWRDAFRAITKLSFNPTNPVCITFVGEPAVDEGGPRREFFTLALAAMVEDVTMFHGPPHSKYVTDFVKTLHLHTSNFTTLGTHNLTSKEDIIFKFSQVIEQC